jgi:hypothetical protein
VFASADIGGTLTDVVLRWSDGVGSVAKVLSTTGRLEDAILTAIDEAAASRGLDAVVVEQFAHGSTVATNALLEGRGARIGLATTAGFGDVLELARLRRPSLFDLSFVKAPPLVPRDRRLEVGERIDATASCASDLQRARSGPWPHSWWPRTSKRSRSACSTPTSSPPTSGRSLTASPRRSQSSAMPCPSPCRQTSSARLLTVVEI